LFGEKIFETLSFPNGIARFACDAGYEISHKHRACSVGVGAGVSGWTGEATKCTPCGLGSYGVGGPDAACTSCAANEVTGIDVRRLSASPRARALRSDTHTKSRSLCVSLPHFVDFVSTRRQTALCARLEKLQIQSASSVGPASAGSSATARRCHSRATRAA
jgi:hypothetical protein